MLTNNFIFCFSLSLYIYEPHRTSIHQPTYNMSEMP